MRCIGAPVWNWEGQVVAAVSVTGTTSRINADTLDQIASHVKRAALGFSRQLGFSSDREAPARDAHADSHDAA